MNQKQITHLSIDGKAMPSFTSIKLKQRINDHHQFKIILDTNVIEITGGYTIDKSKHWLGKTVIITFKETEFLGIITNINLSNSNGHNGSFIIKGYSPTILLEGGKYMHSWVKKGLNTIVNETLELLDLEKKVKPIFTDIIEYQVQYNESHYQFLQRLAKQYNEWFFYNGIQVIFGKPQKKESITIEYGTEITDLNIQIKVADHNHTIYTYNALQDTFISSESTENLDGLNELGMHAFITSSKLYKQKKNTFSNLDLSTKYQIDTLVERKQAQIKASLHLMKAKSTKQGLTVGSIIKVTSAKVDNSGSFKIQNYGEYMITSIKHKATEHFEYSNEFTAIPSGISVPKEPKVILPKAAPQLATVIANKDEKGQGRVKVRFQWQTGTMQTSWVRVMTPDAGKTDKHGEIRGNLVIPEIDDQVMVCFEYDNPNLPFVMGSMYHGTNIKNGIENKNSLISREGSKIIMDDNDGSLQITDKGGVNIKFNGKGTSTINATKTNIINVGASKNKPPQSIIKADKDGNIILDAKTSITLKVGENFISINEEGLIELNGENLNQIAKNKFDVKAKKVSQKAEGANFKINSDKKVIVSGGDEVKLK